MSTDAVNPNPVPAAPSTVSPKVWAALLTGLALVALQAVLTALTPEMFTWAGEFSGLVYSTVTAVGAALAAYLKADPSRLVLFGDGYDGKHVAQ